MPHSTTIFNRAQGPSPATAWAAMVLLAAVLCCGAQSAHAADTAAKPTADATVKVTAFPPSVHIDAKSDASKDEDSSADASSPTKRAPAHLSDFDETIEKMPWIIGVIFLVLGSIFLTPVVLLVGIIWYKLRKTRLQNEAMLALAAKGIVPPAQAADALATSASPATVAPQVYQEAVALRKRVVWSDLRKGIIMAMLGLALSFYSMTSEGSSNWLGLVLIFVGLGYIALWWLEGRQLERTGGTAGNGGVKPGGG